MHNPQIFKLQTKYNIDFDKLKSIIINSKIISQPLISLGFNTDIGAFSYINAKYEVVIEDEVQIGSHCSIYSVSTIDNSSGKVVLKNNCRIGSHSTILPGVSIGKNSIIGAHSLVNKDIPDNVVAFGVPAKVMRKLNNDK